MTPPIDRIKIEIFTDGSGTTKGRKEGGIGVYLRQGETEITVRRGYYNTTTARMEMRALLTAVEMIDPNEWTDVTVISDSQFVVNSFRLGWLQNWRLNNWRGVKNSALWAKILQAIEGRKKMRFCIKWVAGHEKDLSRDYIYGNNVADALANYKTQETYIEDID